MIYLSCPSCHKELEAKDGLAGKRVKCNSCGITLVVPGRGVSSDPGEGTRPAAAALPARAGSGPPQRSLWRRIGSKLWLPLVGCAIVLLVCWFGYRVITVPSAEEEATFTEYAKVCCESLDLQTRFRDKAEAEAALPRLRQLHGRMKELSGQVGQMSRRKRDYLRREHRQEVEFFRKKMNEVAERAMRGEPVVGFADDSSAAIVEVP
jgi:hypothetical protein